MTAKNVLDFKVPFLPGWGDFNFFHCFASAYVFAEGLDISGIADYPCPPRNNGLPCHGCGNVRKGKCEHAMLNKVSPYAFMFDAMSGRSSLRLRYDGEPTEMQKLVGSIGYIADFLFGFAGYEYRKCADGGAFRDEIAASIDAGKPVIAETKRGAGRDGCFHVITGYDGDALACPSEDYFYKRERPEGPPAYGDLAALYIFGSKTAPRYTLKDGLNNIRKAVEYTVSEKLWDGYLVKMGGWDAFPSDDGLDNADMDEKKKRMERMLYTIRFSMNAHFVDKAFQDIHIRHEEMRDPKLAGYWKEIRANSIYIGHGIENKIAGINWDTVNPAAFRGISKAVCEGIVKNKAADLKLLEALGQAIGVLGKK